MFTLSLYDVRQLQQFTGIPELTLIEKKYDKEILEEAQNLGMNISEGYTYEFHLHRPISSKTSIFGFVLKGSYRTDSGFRRSVAYTSEAQILSNIRGDVSLIKELCSLSGGSFDYSKILEDDVEKDRENIESIEEDFDENTKVIHTMTALLLEIRGNAYNDYGNFKTYKEWMNG